MPPQIVCGHCGTPLTKDQILVLDPTSTSVPADTRSAHQIIQDAHDERIERETQANSELTKRTIESQSNSQDTEAQHYIEEDPQIQEETEEKRYTLDDDEKPEGYGTHDEHSLDGGVPLTKSDHPTLAVDGAAAPPDTAPPAENYEGAGEGTVVQADNTAGGLDPDKPHDATEVGASSTAGDAAV